MARMISIGNQDFESIREKNSFYIDKTSFIKEWWENQDIVTLITRPRRFGKTLNMSMLNCFFSNKYENRADLFEGLDIWKEEKFREIQGTYPVIFLSFAEIKTNNFKDTREQICFQIVKLYNENDYLYDSGILNDNEKKFFKSINMDMSDAVLSVSINQMCCFMQKYYGKKVIILLDEYDTPMQEAYVNGYWEELVAFTRSLFNSTFKTNSYLERAIMTGITRVSKESIFSDLNNLEVVTTTSGKYESAFGFTEKEVFASLDNYELNSEKEKVKAWYDGFTFGDKHDIYNPWSIINFLDKKKFAAYWADTSSNMLVNKLLQTAPVEIKKLMEQLLKRESIEVKFDEQIVFDQLDSSIDAIWSLLVASGYLKIESIEHKGLAMKPWYHISITNFETLSMFASMFLGWFENSDTRYNDFIKALLKGSVKEMNYYMNKVALATFSYFDTGKQPSEILEPERFYHGFVLGLIVELSDKYEVKSNRESGFGRYDVMIVPYEKKENAIVLEFKVHDSDEEKTLEETVQAALKQIEEKNYDAELINRGVKKENIHHYGFAFEGKEVLIDGR